MGKESAALPKRPRTARRTSPIGGPPPPRDALERPYTVGRVGVPPPGPHLPPPLLPFPCLRLTAKILLRRLRCQEDFKLQNFRPAFGRDHRRGVAAKPPSLPPPFRPPSPPFNTSLPPLPPILIHPCPPPPTWTPPVPPVTLWVNQGSPQTTRPVHPLGGSVMGWRKLRITQPTDSPSSLVAGARSTGHTQPPTHANRRTTPPGMRSKGRGLRGGPRGG